MTRFAIAICTWVGLTGIAAAQTPFNGGDGKSPPVSSVAAPYSPGMQILPPPASAIAGRFAQCIAGRGPIEPRGTGARATSIAGPGPSRVDSPGGGRARRTTHAAAGIAALVRHLQLAAHGQRRSLRRRICRRLDFQLPVLSVPLGRHWRALGLQRRPVKVKLRRAEWRPVGRNNRSAVPACLMNPAGTALRLFRPTVYGLGERKTYLPAGRLALAGRTGRCTPRKSANLPPSR